MGETLARHTGPVPAALIVFGICFIPLLSTLTGPGLIIVLAAGILTGEQIAAAEASPFLALPVLLALDARLGGGFISPGLAFGEDEKETLNPGLPGIVFTRLMLLPAALAALCLFTFGF
jgi:sorbitol-specific phosphotransferase system component IIBC